LLDSGNLTVNVISDTFASILGLTPRDLQVIPGFDKIRTAKGSSHLQVIGKPKISLKLRFDPKLAVVKFPCVVVKGLTMAVNIGGSFLAQNNIVQSHGKGTIGIGSVKIPLMTYSQATQNDAGECGALDLEKGLGDFPVYLKEPVRVPPRSIMRVPLCVPAVSLAGLGEGEVLVTRASEFTEKAGVLTPRHVIAHIAANGQAYAAVLNPSSQYVRVPGNLRYGSGRMCCAPEDRLRYPWRTVATLGPHNDSPMSVAGKPSREWLCAEFKLNDSPYLQSQKHKDQAIALLQEFPGLYSDGTVLGRTTLLEHAIHLQHSRPIAIRPRRVNPKYREAEQEQIKVWKKQGIIEDSSSAYSFPMIPVPKKDGSVRFCIDYRKLNEITYKDAYPLPVIEDNLAQLKDSVIFSALDNVGAFHSVPLREGDQPKTAFSSSEGLFQFRYLPFGLMNGPPTYSRLVKLVLKDVPLTVALPYLDDCCVHSRSFDEHVTGLRSVFQAYQNAGLKLKPSKCMLFMDHITYLGHEISKDGIQIASRYVEIVRNWPAPTTRAEIRTFLGKTGYYRKFIPAYAATVDPLQRYMRDVPENEMKTPLEIDDAGQAAFLRLKDALCRAPILAYPDFNSSKPFVLDTDWSLDNKTIGGVLSQVQEGHERVIAYGARRLRKSEQNYTATKGELLAVITFINQWKQYLMPKKFLLRTDHKALTWLRTMQEPTGMVQRWLDLLASYDFTVEHRAGKDHGNADALSRAPHVTEEVSSPEEALCVGALPADLDLSPAAMRGLQVRDPVLGEVRRWVDLEVVWPSRRELRARDPALTYYLGQKTDLRFDADQVLVCRQRICLPKDLQWVLLKNVHEVDVAHKGTTETTERATSLFMCPKLGFICQQIVRSCPACLRKQPYPSAQRRQLRSQAAGSPFDKLSIDIMGPLHPASARGNLYLLTAKDTFTKWLEAIPVPDTASKTLTDALAREVFARHGLPARMHMDNATYFRSHEFTAFCQRYRIIPTYSPAYHPQSNPVERSHRDLNDALRGLLQGRADWEESLPEALLAIRAASHSTTGFSPFVALYGREPMLPTALAIGKRPEGRDIEGHVPVQVRRSEQIHEKIRQHTGLALEKANLRYSQDPVMILAPGDLVHVTDPAPTGRIPPKFRPKWRGPYPVVRAINDMVYLVDLNNGHGGDPIHIDRLSKVDDRARRYRASQDDGDDEDGPQQGEGPLGEPQPPEQLGLGPEGPGPEIGQPGGGAGAAGVFAREPPAEQEEEDMEQAPVFDESEVAQPAAPGVEDENETAPNESGLVLTTPSEDESDPDDAPEGQLVLRNVSPPEDDSFPVAGGGDNTMAWDEYGFRPEPARVTYTPNYAAMRERREQRALRREPGGEHLALPAPEGGKLVDYVPVSTDSSGSVRLPDELYSSTSPEIDYDRSISFPEAASPMVPQNINWNRSSDSSSFHPLAHSTRIVGAERHPVAIAQPSDGNEESARPEHAVPRAIRMDEGEAISRSPLPSMPEPSPLESWEEGRVTYPSSPSVSSTPMDAAPSDRQKALMPVETPLAIECAARGGLEEPAGRAPPPTHSSSEQERDRSVLRRGDSDRSGAERPPHERAPSCLPPAAAAVGEVKEVSRGGETEWRWPTPPPALTQSEVIGPSPVREEATVTPLPPSPSSIRSEHSYADVASGAAAPHLGQNEHSYAAVPPSPPSPASIRGEHSYADEKRKVTSPLRRDAGTDQLSDASTASAPETGRETQEGDATAAPGIEAPTTEKRRARKSRHPDDSVELAEKRRTVTFTPRKEHKFYVASSPSEPESFHDAAESWQGSLPSTRPKTKGGVGPQYSRPENPGQDAPGRKKDESHLPRPGKRDRAAADLSFVGIEARPGQERGAAPTKTPAFTLARAGATAAEYIKTQTQTVKSTFRSYQPQGTDHQYAARCPDQPPRVSRPRMDPGAPADDGAASRTASAPDPGAAARGGRSLERERKTSPLSRGFRLRSVPAEAVGDGNAGREERPHQSRAPRGVGAPGFDGDTPSRRPRADRCVEPKQHARRSVSADRAAEGSGVARRWHGCPHLPGDGITCRLCRRSSPYAGRTRRRHRTAGGWEDPAPRVARTREGHDGSEERDGPGCRGGTTAPGHAGSGAGAGGAGAPVA